MKGYEIAGLKREERKRTNEDSEDSLNIEMDMTHIGDDRDEKVCALNIE